MEESIPPVASPGQLTGSLVCQSQSVEVQHQTIRAHNSPPGFGRLIDLLNFRADFAQLLYMIRNA
ncbi:hypothetical protein DPMN_013558 [Dreissena polymorpha]|uniref:Uncharacterized protein n=1 Tax=Dreissena polymorpha TaxID=45954 RepID=A0A9D4S2L4_DREPO|nr:hypothetical protein DPMN_013558 [Dreissena polymorpha]